MSKDPVCGMSVAEDSALRAEHLGRTYYFCSAHCAQAFEAEPARYTNSDQAEAELLQTHAEHGAGRSANLHAPTAGDCPSCATSLEPATALGTPTDMEYTCPMHPQVRQPGPGTCPKCGMALEPVGRALPAAGIEYVCPMHPEVVRDRPGTCPKCGMALEPRQAVADERNPELVDMSRRFWVSPAGISAGDGCGPRSPMAARWLIHGGGSMDRARLGHARGVVGWVAILCPRLAIGGDREPQHVHADRAGRRRGLGL